MNYSYVMGVNNIDKLKANGFETEQFGEHYGVTFDDNKIELFEEYIYKTLENGFWNEYLGKEIIFIFKFKNGEIKKSVLNNNNEDEILKLCCEFADCKFESVDKMLRDNEFYAETYYMEEKVMRNYLLIHGSFGSPFVNWFPYLRGEIEKRNLIVYTPDFPTGVGYQNYNNWEKVLESYLSAGIINENTIIFAHSIAPIFVCHFLVSHNIKVKRLVFVCGFNNYLGINEEYDNVNKTMYFDNLEDVKELAKEIICFYSKNDPYVKYEAEKEFADTIATKQVVIDDGGHLNSESGYTNFTELVEYL